LDPPPSESHFLPIRKAKRREKALTHFLATREQKAEKVPGTTKSVVQKTVQISCRVTYCAVTVTMGTIRIPVLTVYNTILNGPGSAVGIATAYMLESPGIESRLGARFFTPVQTGPEVHPASRTMGTGSFPGVRCGRGVMLTPHPLLVQRSKIE
jgi:hypothetical protein